MIAELHPYSPRAHRAYVLSTWERGSGKSRDLLAGMLPELSCVVAAVPGEPDDLMGWAAVERGGAVVWCHVRRVFWRMTAVEPGGLRVLAPNDSCGGLATAMLAELGVNLHAPTACRYWSPMAARIAQAGMARPGGVRIYHDPRKERAVA